MKFLKIMLFTAILMGIMAVIVFAGPVDWIKGAAGKIGLELGAGAITVLIGFLTAGTGAGYVFMRIMKTMIEAGEFFAAIGEAMQDKKISPEEISEIYGRGKDVFNVWRDSEFKPT
jgi:hypothetical protein